MSRITYLSILIVMFMVAAILLTACAKKEQQGQISPKMQAEHVVTVDYDKLVTEIESVQEQIRIAPNDSGLHAKLVELGTDSSAKTIRAVGKGMPPSTAQSPYLAQQAAKEAAYIDACQWLAYMLQWRHHPSTPSFGTIHADLPGARTVHTIVEQDLTKVLVEADVP